MNQYPKGSYSVVYAKRRVWRWVGGWVGVGWNGWVYVICRKLLSLLQFTRVYLNLK